MAWQSIRGHDAIVQQFQSAFQRGRLAHAYLLVGPPGVGKRLFAKELAKAILCEKPPAPLTACDRCPGCKLVAAESHPDFTVFRTPEDKHEFPVEVMHTLVATLGLKPSRGPRKVAFVEDAGDFNEESANAFLKTLEEPPPGSLLLLRATSLESQLATILSRCQPVRFAPLSWQQIREVLIERGISDPAKLDELAKLSRGSVGRAIALNDPALGDFRRAIIDALAAPKLNHAAFAERWTKFIEEAGKESSLQRARASLALQLLIDLLQHALWLSLAGESADIAPLKTFALRMGPEKVLGLIDACLDADRHVEQRVNVPITLELLADRLGAAA